MRNGERELYSHKVWYPGAYLCVAEIPGGDAAGTWELTFHCDTEDGGSTEEPRAYPAAIAVAGLFPITAETARA